MGKKKTAEAIEDNTPDLLVKSKNKFEIDLLERIRIGDELLQRQVNTPEEYSKLHSDYVFWHDFNCEFLNRAFNKTNNQYYREYTYSPSFSISSGIPRKPSFREVVDETKGRVSKYLLRLQKIKEKLVLIDEVPGLSPPVTTHVDIQEVGLKHLENIFSRFHRLAQSLRHRHSNRETLIIKDEYDVQDLLRSLLHLYFDDIREEDYAPSYAGGNSRIDFVLKQEKIIIETKMTNDHLKDKEIGSQLLIDIGRYRSHPDGEILVVFVYDKSDFVRNKIGLISDLEKLSSTELKIRIFIDPK